MVTLMDRGASAGEGYLLVYILVFVGTIVIGALLSLPRILRPFRAIRRAAELKQHLQGQYRLDDLFISPWDLAVFGVRYDDRIALIGHDQNVEELRFQQLLEAELIVDGTVASAVSRGSQLGGAAIGGVLLAPFGMAAVGLLAGGLSGRRNEKRATTDIQLRLRTSSRSWPVHHFTIYRSDDLLLEGKKGLAAGRDHLRQLTAIGDHVCAVALNCIQAGADTPTNLSQDLPPTEVLERLWKLKEAGVLTAAEFNAQKAALLAR